VLVLFSIILFLSAFLLFWVQLMLTKMALPLLGGSPWVWNTCAFFFQTVLLLGYSYACFTPLRRGTRWHMAIHWGLLLIPLVCLPIRFTTVGLPPTETNPIPWLLGLLAIAVGLPFLMVATTAPLLQQWFAHTNHPDRADPYFLYGASNLGSLLSLLAYPTVIEPLLPLSRQGELWAVGYGLLVALIGVGAIAIYIHSASQQPASQPLASQQLDLDQLVDQLDQPVNQRLDNHPSDDLAAPLSTAQQTRWLGLSFLPSSLLLGVTTYIATDLASVPFLWAIPLAIYLLSFVLTFTRQFRLPLELLCGIAPIALTILLLGSLLQVPLPLWLSLPLHLLGFGLVAVIFHGELFKTRPPAIHLTRFYFWISLGGVLGGLLNAIAAPLLFPTVTEYPLTLLLSLLLLPRPTNPTLSSSPFRLIPTLSLGIVIGVLVVGLGVQPLLNYGWLGGGLAIGGTIALSLASGIHHLRLGLNVALVILLGQFAISTPGKLLATERSFFGVNRVIYEAKTNAYSLLHGTTLHGKQIHSPHGQLEPLTYFHPTGPIGQLFSRLPASRFQQVGVLGLGIGTLAAYAQPGQHWTFYEIDPTVVQLARDRRFFSFLQAAKVPVSIVLGDGRLSLQSVPAHSLDLLVIDVFSSDAIPVHLFTREALQLYASKLAPGGLVAVNISNRYINLEPVLAALAQELGLVGRQQRDEFISEGDRAAGKLPSQWILLARQSQDLGALLTDQRWRSLTTASSSVWTDDFSNIVQALRW